MSNNNTRSELRLMVGRNEKILCQGKPDKLCYVLEGIFNPLLPLAILWLLFDSLFIVAGLASGDSKTAIALLGFFALHLMPVWMYLSGVIFVFQRYKHAEYIITDKGVYVSSGLFSYTCNMKPFTELARVNIHRGIIDQMLGVGDVVLTSNNVADIHSSNGNKRDIGITIEDVRDYRRIFKIIKKLQEDTYTDTMYPNDLRPDENHGYKTKYKNEI